MKTLKGFLLSMVCVLGSAPLFGAGPDAPPLLSTPVALPSAEVHYQPFAVSARAARAGHYVPSGYMGDLGSLNMSGAYVPTHDSTPGTPLRVVYRPSGNKGWAGVYWQQPANNWGDRAGQTGYDLTGARKLVFWARGDKGGEKIREFRIGGIVGRYPDSDVAILGPIKLTADWKRYEIDLSKKDLKHIIGGFSFSVNKYDNVGEMTFYLDDIAYELPATAAAQKAGAPAVAAIPVPLEEPPMPVPTSPSKEIQIKSDGGGLRVSFSSQLLFNVGKTSLRAESIKMLNQVSELLKAYPKNNVLVEGHTDGTGSADYNLQLSRLRAQSVRDVLIKNGGFDPQRFTVVGYGQTHPVADNDTKSGQALNRRVEVVILKTAEKL